MSLFEIFVVVALISICTYGVYSFYQQDKKYKEETGDNW